MSNKATQNLNLIPSKLLFSKNHQKKLFSSCFSKAKLAMDLYFYYLTIFECFIKFAFI